MDDDSHGGHDPRGVHVVSTETTHVIGTATHHIGSRTTEAEALALLAEIAPRYRASGVVPYVTIEPEPGLWRRMLDRLRQ